MMKPWEVVVSIGHMGCGRSREELRYLMARTAVEARDIAYSWGGVKGVLVVRPCADEVFVRVFDQGEESA
ncbi:MAG: hypothetical protein ACYDG6_06770 [Thermincolia bacterium]